MPTYSQQGPASGIRYDKNGRPYTGGGGTGGGTGYYNQVSSGSSYGTQGGGTAPQLQGMNWGGAAAAFAPRDPFQNPGNNLVNPGYDEQAFLYTQNRLLEDPSAGLLTDAYNNTQKPGQGEQRINDNLGALDGPGQGQQYWNQVGGQFQDPFAGEQFAREATQNFGSSGPASAFYNQSMGQYDQFTGYSGPQNTQGQYGQSSSQLAGGTQGEQGLGALAGQYGNIGQYQGGNNALGQYQQNASSGPMAAQSFYDQVGGSYGEMGQYNDPNLAAGQYAQTQGAFGEMPIANFDPFYDRARQLATQDFNRQSAGRGVYGSSEALSGVGNVITDIEAQRANRSFDAEMQRAQEQRMRQELLGNQARMGDLSSLAAFGANLSGLETYGNLAKNAGDQTIQQQTMLGNQARNADLTGLDAFGANINAVTAFGNINNQLATQELDRHDLLGSMANNADTQALGAQNANIQGLQAFGNIANNADAAETNRYEATTTAMNNADKTALDRLSTGADIAFKGDESERLDFDSSTRAAESAARLGLDRNRQGADIARTLGQADLERLEAVNRIAGQAEGSRQARQNTRVTAEQNRVAAIQNTLNSAFSAFMQGDQQAWENSFNAEIAPYLQAMGKNEQEIAALRNDPVAVMQLMAASKGMAAPTPPATTSSTTRTAAPSRKLDPTNPYG